MTTAQYQPMTVSKKVIVPPNVAAPQIIAIRAVVVDVLKIHVPAIATIKLIMVTKISATSALFLSTAPLSSGQVEVQVCFRPTSPSFMCE
ncbi:hypothetical protein [Actinomadura montaniterrae]|uniref:Uncharacterized protein n=1 Tax=Actinomadura montaniterrae TaxID=1803903 RepID=A0A6L3VXR1_9ACTN|nr:hypothetical protein [Actinomadura montaniterrae]KAB2383399.1 hypothetical protein F9B16_12775 [Actinomadura montaniterrae]